MRRSRFRLGFVLYQSAGGTGPIVDHKTLAVVVTIGFSVIGVLGDDFLELAQPRWSFWYGSRSRDELRQNKEKP